ncbi:hypothetical protein ACHAWO_003213 [Cyclotella atomus]|uniref:Uncharacterized protein n=1 Tax=Cyclotella atomus TaxID=382360 RepID=A0ABD3P9Z7_9STRA
MSSSRFAKLLVQNKSAWMGGLAVVTLGVAFKVTYFNFSRGLLVDHMDRRHIAATEHLSKARQFAQVKAKDREQRLPPLTDEQREQLHEYLRLLAEREPEIYPNTDNLTRRRG